MQGDRLMRTKPTLCLDFDGVIHSYSSGWKGANVIPDPPVDGAIDALMGYLDHFVVCIHTSRFNAENEGKGLSPSPMTAVAEWLERCGVPPALIVRNADSEPFGLTLGCVNLCRTKPPALVTIDDRAVTFDGTFPSADEIRAFRPWNKTA